MQANAIVPYDNLESVLLYSDLQSKEIGSYGEERLPFPKVNQDIMINIISFLFNRDVLSLSCTNRSAFLLTNNINNKFWESYSKGVFQLNFKPEKSVFTCLLNAGENELLQKINEEFISKLQPNKAYKFQASFMSPADKDGNRTLLEPAFEIYVGNYSANPIISKWIIKDEFMPSFCELVDKKHRAFSNKYPKRVDVIYGNILNMPSFINAKQFQNNQRFEEDLFIHMINNLGKGKLEVRKEFENTEEFTQYVNNAKERYNYLECVKDHEIYECIIDDVAQEYVLTLNEDERVEFNTYRKNKANFHQRKAILDEKFKIPGNKPDCLKNMETSLNNRIDSISSPEYLKKFNKIGLPPSPKKVEAKSQATCAQMAMAVVVLLMALSFFDKIVFAK
ncbi:MAG: hypothetical protein H0U49_03460 [Parachlamydiaceae bacterium]|nr:hypothetical protein [Parachlamydiaceae bacterium]